MLLGASGVLAKEGKNVCFRAIGTKAAPGKGRELRPKWENLSWVPQNLSLMDFSAALGQKEVCKPKGQKGSNPRSPRPSLRPFLYYFPQFSPNSRLEQGV